MREKWSCMREHYTAGLEAATSHNNICPQRFVNIHMKMPVLQSAFNKAAELYLKKAPTQGLQLY